MATAKKENPPKEAETAEIHRPDHFRELDELLDELVGLRKKAWNLKSLHGNLADLLNARSVVTMRLLPAIDKYIKAEHDAASGVLKGDSRP